MAIKLYTLSGSPYAWRVWLALEHKQLAYETQLLSYTDGDTRTAAFTALNPRCKVPVLVEDGFALYESAAIVEYLDDKHAASGARLFPGGPEQRALVRRMVCEIDSYIGRFNHGLASQIFYHPAEAWDAKVLAEGAGNWLWDLELYERQMSGDYLAGELSAADFTLYPFVAQVGRMESRGAKLGILAAMGPKLTAWKARMEALPYFKKTWPPAWK